MKHYIPNALTIARIVAVPFMMWGILAIGRGDTGLIASPSFLLILFLLATISDFFDGYLARKWGVTSDFGRMIDPIADKLLVSGCLFAITINFNAAWYVIVPAVVIIWRDVLVSGLREHAAHKARILAPTRLAKWKTAVEMLAIGGLIVWVILDAWLPINDIIPPATNLILKVSLALLWIAALLSAYTGFIYFRAGLRSQT